MAGFLIWTQRQSDQMEAIADFLKKEKERDTWQYASALQEKACERLGGLIKQDA